MQAVFHIFILFDVPLALQQIGDCPVANTPAAIVYKATCPDEKRVVCTVATLAEAAEQENIKKTALIIVGDVTAQAGYERSRLYAPEFTTEFRQGTDGFVYE